MFNEIGCDSCHTPRMITGSSESKALHNKIARLYSDLLLHDMGPGPVDSHTAPENPTAREFRTPPLWGLARTTPPYMHDGGSRTIEDAILRHEGEAIKVRDRYKTLSEDEKLQLEEFLRSL